MNTIAILLACLASAAAKEYTACLKLYNPNGGYEGSVSFSQSSGRGYQYVTINPHLEIWPAGMYRLYVHKEMDHDGRCANLVDIETSPEFTGELWAIFLERFSSNGEMATVRYSYPSSLDPSNKNSIIGRSVAFYKVNTVSPRDPFDAKSSEMFACGYVFQLKYKNAPCGEQDPRTSPWVFPDD